MRLSNCYDDKSFLINCFRRIVFFMSMWVLDIFFVAQVSIFSFTATDKYLINTDFILVNFKYEN